MSILRVNTITDKGGNTLLSSDGAGTLTLPSALKNTPAFQVYASANTSVSSGTNTQIVLDTVMLDTASGFNTGTRRYTVQEAGWYFLYYRYRWETATNFNPQRVWVSYNSSVYASDNIMSTWGAQVYYDKMGSYETRQLAVNDTIELFAYQASGSSQNLAGGDDYGLNTTFGGFKLIGA